VLAEMINLTLHHGLFATRGANDISQALALLDEWQPHVAVIDMDIAGDQFMRRARFSVGDAARLPVLALTRRGTSRPICLANHQVQHVRKFLDQQGQCVDSVLNTLAGIHEAARSEDGSVLEPKCSFGLVSGTRRTFGTPCGMKRSLAASTP
jgi:CheY-like chemotaxis protein